MTQFQSVCRDELEHLINSIPFENLTAVTLTLKKRAGSRAADTIIASENLRLFRIRLETRVLGPPCKEAWQAPPTHRCSGNEC
jgi:hypothetical protein